MVRNTGDKLRDRLALFLVIVCISFTGTAASSQRGKVAVSVTNPNPGSATSGSLNLQVFSGPSVAPLISASPTTVTLPASGSATGALTGPVPSTYFGMHVMTASDWPTVRIGALGKVSGSQWPYVEQVRGQFDWTHLDAWVNEARAHGISLMYSTGGVPPWAAADKSTCHPLGYFGAGSICQGLFPTCKIGMIS